MGYRFLELFFPPKCVLCGELLAKEETDLCQNCRQNTPEFPGSKIKFSFLAQWCAIWYYKDTVRESILRYKFRQRIGYSETYGRLLAMKLQKMGWDDCQVLTWVPIAWLRRRTRGFDQVELLAKVTARELGLTPVATLKKIRNTKPQSGMGSAAMRRANVLGAYRVPDPSLVKGKTVLLLDDVVTTGATASECARMLLTAGAKEVKLATIAVASFDKTR